VKARKKCGQAFGVNVQMLSNALKAFIVFRCNRNYFNSSTCICAESVVAYFFLDFLVLLHQGKRINNPSFSEHSIEKCEIKALLRQIAFFVYK